MYRCNLSTHIRIYFRISLVAKRVKLECYITASNHFRYVHFKLLISSVLRCVLWASEKSNASTAVELWVKGEIQEAQKTENVNQTIWKNLNIAVMYITITKNSSFSFLLFFKNSKIYYVTYIRICYSYICKNFNSKCIDIFYLFFVILLLILT